MEFCVSMRRLYRYRIVLSSYRLMLSVDLWRMDIIHCPVFYLKLNSNL
jgi:hypothetical protein